MLGMQFDTGSLQVNLDAPEGFMDGKHVYLGSSYNKPQAVILEKPPLAQMLLLLACYLPLHHRHLGPGRGQTDTLAATTSTQSFCNTSHHAI